MDWVQYCRIQILFETLRAFVVALFVFFAVSCAASGAEQMKEKGKIYIVPIGNIETDVLNMLKNGLPKSFDLLCDIGEATKMPKGIYDKSRKQYHSTAILKELKKLERTPSDVKKILGVADNDLFVPELNFVFGEAYVDGRCAVMSLTRLKQEFYGKRRNDKLFKKRALTEAVHELGHTFGLRHCKDTKCVMRFSNSLSDTDKKGSQFCKNCRRLMKKR